MATHRQKPSSSPHFEHPLRFVSAVDAKYDSGSEIERKLLVRHLRQVELRRTRMK